MLVPNSVHFTEICLTSNRPERECPSRRYVFERHPRKKLKLPVSDIKEVILIVFLIYLLRMNDQIRNYYR